MRIGLFTEHDSGAEGGFAATIDAIVSRRPPDSTIHRYDAPAGLASFIHARDFLVRTEAHRLDVVHLAATGPAAIVALLVATRLGLPVIGSFHPPVPPASGIQKAYLRTLIRRSRRLLVTSLAAREKFIHTGVAASKITVWRPGVDASMFAPWKRSDALRSRWGVTDARPAVIYAGSVSDDRGADLLRTLEVALHRTRPMHQLIVAGDGRNRDETQARCPNAIFLGAVPYAKMPEILASADVYVCPNQASSSNLTVLQAQASGLPVIVMERGSARERIADTSAIVCRGYADFIVETAALVRTDARRRAMSVAAREFAMRQEWAPGLTSIYAEYRAAAEISRVRRDLEPAFIAQGRRF